ncbi:MAG TPA: hypothetical protein VHY18_07605 [Solirubrobacteraceae bacterium]|nr:hypothetical protein [Solirubrobacteraceae bacterium]
MYPEVRFYADPFEGLTVQLTELRGLIKIVPPLIEADRERRWEEIGERPSDGEDGEVIDVYGAEAGAEEGWGFADFGRTIRVAAVVFAWAVFQDYLAHELKRSYLSYDLSKYPALEVLVKDDVSNWDRRFDRIVARYLDFADIPLSKLPSWHHVLHAQALRNALVHNQGQYTQAYLKTKHPYRPTEEELYVVASSTDDAGLIDEQVIPLSPESADAVITQLRTAATEVREAIDQARRN